MRKAEHGGRVRWLWVAGLLLVAAPMARAESPGPEPGPAPAPTPTPAAAQAVAVAPEPKPLLDIYGFAMLDMGFQTGQNHPDWYDVLRPTKLPAFENEFGEDGRYFAGVRQSRLGVKGFIPTSAG